MSSEVFFDPDLLPDLEWVYIEGGDYTMGATVDGDYTHSLIQGGVNYPTHDITLSPYELQKTEVLNSQYAVFLQLMQDNGLIYREYYESTTGQESGYEVFSNYGPFKDKGLLLYEGVSVSEDPINECYIDFDEDTETWFVSDEDKANWPVVYLRWHGAAALAYHFNLTLPTEAQWEFAASGGEYFAYATNDGTLSEDNANYNNNVGHPLPACSYPENPFGLCDMAGNAWEWVFDWYRSDWYLCSTTEDPSGPEGDDELFEDDDYEELWSDVVFETMTKIIRGGSYNYHAATMEATFRHCDRSVRGNDHFSTRLARPTVSNPPYTPDSCNTFNIPQLGDVVLDDPLTVNEGTGAWLLTMSFIVAGAIGVIMHYRENRARVASTSSSSHVAYSAAPTEDPDTMDGILAGGSIDRPPSPL